MIVRKVVPNPRHYSSTSYEAYMNRYENIFPSKPNEHECREFTCLEFNCQCFPVPLDRMPQVVDMDIFSMFISVRITLEDMEKFFKYQLTLVQLLKRAICIVIQTENDDVFRIVNHADYVDDMVKNRTIPHDYIIKGTTYA